MPRLVGFSIINIVICFIVRSSKNSQLNMLVPTMIWNLLQGEEATVETVDDVQYITPSVPPGHNVYFTEHFDSVDHFKKKWVKSEAKKDGIDEEIAKYDGKL